MVQSNTDNSFLIMNRKNKHKPIGWTPDIDPDEEWPASNAYDCFADPDFLASLPQLLKENEKWFTERRRGLEEAGKISLADLQTRVGVVA